MACYFYLNIAFVSSAVAAHDVYTELLAACNGGSFSCDLVLIPTVQGTNSGGGEIFRTCPDGPWGPPSLLYNGYRVFPGSRVGRGGTLTTQPLLVPWSRKSRAIRLFPFWDVRPVLGWRLPLPLPTLCHKVTLQWLKQLTLPINSNCW